MAGSNASLAALASCQPNGGKVVATLDGAPAGASFDCFLYHDTFFTIGASDATGRVFTFTNLPNGTYTVEASTQGTSAGSPGDGDIVASTFTRVECVVAPSGGGEEPPSCDLVILSTTSTATTAIGSATGTLTVQLGGSAPGKVVMLTRSPGFGVGPFPVDAQGFHTFSNLLAGRYLVQATDASPAHCAATTFVTVAEFARAGCRDPAASNYDPLATQDATCTYAPVQPTAVLSFPAAQSLRFVVPPLPGYGSVDQQTPDNTLLADQRIPGITQPPYCQKVARRDTLHLQWKSTFANHSVHLIACASGAVIRSFPAARLVRGQGNVARFAVYLTAHTNASQARLYFQAAVLPLPLLPGNRLQLSGFGMAALEGNFPVIEVREDVKEGVPYVVLNVPFDSATALPRVDGQATTIFSVAAFDVWQVKLNLSTVPAGCYYLRVTATSPALGTARAISEPLELAPEHPGTVLITYHNFDNAFGLNYSNGLLNQLRVSARLFELETDMTKEVLLESTTRTTLLSAVARRKRRLETFLLPPYLHEKLALAFAHDLVTVQGEEYVSEEKYERTVVERYGLLNGSVLLTQREGFGSANGDDLGDLNQGQGFIIVNEGFLRY
jgi:hypothetical protein